MTNGLTVRANTLDILRPQTRGRNQFGCNFDIQIGQLDGGQGCTRQLVGARRLKGKQLLTQSPDQMAAGKADGMKLERGGALVFRLGPVGEFDEEAVDTIETGARHQPNIGATFKRAR
jgi:hypothetical protein